MIISICTVDGKVHTAAATREEMLKEVDGSVHRLEEMLDAVEDTLKLRDDVTYISLEIHGKQRVFNPRNIIWTEFTR